MLHKCKVCDSLYTEGEFDVCMDCINKYVNLYDDEWLEQILYLIYLRENGHLSSKDSLDEKRNKRQA